MTVSEFPDVRSVVFLSFDASSGATRRSLSASWSWRSREASITVYTSITDITLVTNLTFSTFNGRLALTTLRSNRSTGSRCSRLTR